MLPLATGYSAVAVRSWTVDWAETGVGDRDDALLEIALGNLTVETSYAPGGRLRLVAVMSQRAIVLVTSRDGSHFLAAVDARRGELARSEPLTLPAEALAHAWTELGLPWVAPIDATTLAMPCRANGALCLVRFDGSAFSISEAGLAIEDGLALTAAGPVVTRGDDCRAIEPTSRFGPCDELLAAYPYDGLPLDGTLVTGAAADVSLTSVRHAITLPPLVDAAAPTSGEETWPSVGAGVIVLAAPMGGANDVELDLLVRGDHFAVSYTRVSDTNAATARRDLALALPPGSVDARPVEVGDRSAYRVRVRTTFPIHYSHDCWQGMWVVRAWFEGGSEALANTYAEYGYCD